MSKTVVNWIITCNADIEFTTHIICIKSNLWLLLSDRYYHETFKNTFLTGLWSKCRYWLIYQKWSKVFRKWKRSYLLTQKECVLEFELILLRDLYQSSCNTKFFETCFYYFFSICKRVQPTQITFEISS